MTSEQQCLALVTSCMSGDFDTAYKVLEEFDLRTVLSLAAMVDGFVRRCARNEGKTVQEVLDDLGLRAAVLAERDVQGPR